MEKPVIGLVSRLHGVCVVCFSAHIRSEVSGRSVPQRVSEYDGMYPVSFFIVSCGQTLIWKATETKDIYQFQPRLSPIPGDQTKPSASTCYQVTGKCFSSRMISLGLAIGSAASKVNMEGQLVQTHCCNREYHATELMVCL